MQLPAAIIHWSGVCIYIDHDHTCDSTAGSKKIPFSKPVYRSTVPVDQTTVFENFRKYYENQGSR